MNQLPILGRLAMNLFLGLFCLCLLLGLSRYHHNFDTIPVINMISQILEFDTIP